MENINNEEISRILIQRAMDQKMSDTKYKEIRARRNKISMQIKECLKGDKNYYFKEFFNLGSYKIKTGVQYDNNDYDIDYALVISGEEDENKIKKFKENLTYTIRSFVKDHYIRDVNVSNKKNVIAIRYRDSDDSPLFHLDIPIYLINESHNLKHIVRNESGDYEFIESEPKETHNRQKDLLANNNDVKRHSIILLKDLVKRKFNEINITSIYITEKIISIEKYNVLSYVKEFFYQASINFEMFLYEKPQSNLLMKTNIQKMNIEFKNIHIKIDSFETTKEVYDYLNIKFENKLIELKLVDGNKDVDIHHGG